MIDVKKFISGFLVLAVAAVISGLLFSRISGPSSGGNGQPAANEPQLVGLQNANTATQIPGLMNATSTQDVQAILLAQLNTTSTKDKESDPTNLTNAFADSLLNGLVAANPDGVQVDSSGNEIVNAPDSLQLAVALQGNSTLKNLTVPDWNAEAQHIQINTISDNSQPSVNTYISSLQSVYQKYIGGTDIGSILGERNQNDASIVENHIADALSAATAIPTPSALEGFQRSFLTLLVYEKNATALIESAGNDPVKQSLIFQAEQPGYDLAINNFQTQWQKAAGGMTLPTNPSNASFVNPSHGDLAWFTTGFLGIQTAHAQMAVYDAAVFGVESGNLSVDSGQLGKTIENYIEDILLQILKNVLTTLLQQKVLTWIQGSGAPRFVTNWADELTNSFSAAVQNKLSNWMQCVPQYEAPYIQALVTTPIVNLANSACGNAGAEFNGQLGYNLQNLSANFTNFSDYLNLFQPGGNTWGLVMQVQDSIYTAGATAQTVNTNQNIAQQGWTGSAVCDDGSNPHGTRDVCVVIGADGKPTGATYTLDPNNKNDKCDPSDQLEFIQNNGACADGKTPTITSPGQATGQGFFAGLKSGAENLTSANNIAGILNALLSSLLNTLAQSAINYSTNALNSAMNGGGGSSSDAGLVGINPSSIETSSSTASITQTSLQCLPMQQTVNYDASSSQATASFSALGGSIDGACATSGKCPSNENSDGTPIYTWSAPGSMQSTSNGPAPTGSSFFTTYNATGTYAVTVTASTDNSTSTCTVTVQ